MRKRLSLCAAILLLATVSCQKGPYQRDAQPISFRIFEVLDCKPGMQPMTLSGSNEKYCLAAQPLVTEADVRDARPGEDPSDQAVLNLYFTLKVGERLRAETQRITNEHSARSDRGKMAIVLEGKLVSVPELAGPLGDTIAVGGFTREEAKNLAVRLNSPLQPH